MNIFKRLSFLAFALFLFANVLAQSSHVFAPKSVLSEGRWIKIALSDRYDGVYQISYSQLSSLGFKNPENVGVFGYGGHVLDESFANGHIDDLPEIAVYNDATNKRILFYGQGLISWSYDKKNGFVHTQNPYASKACYFLHEKVSPSLSMGRIENGSIDGEVEEVNVFDAYLLHEEELVNIGKTGRELYGESFSFSQSQLITFKEKLLPGEVKFTANFAALSPTASSFSVKYNNEIIGEASINGSNNDYVFAVESTLNKDIILDKEDAPSFRINFNAKTSVKNAYLNYIRLVGLQEIAINSNKSYTLFRNVKSLSSNLKYTIKEYSGSYAVWDITDPLSIKIQDIADDYSFISPNKGLREYALIDLNGKIFPEVKVIGEVKNQNLHAIEDIDMVIVSPSGLKSSAQQLADYRKVHDKMNVLVVSPEEIYNEYSSGTADATAIRLFMKQLFGRKTISGTDNNGYLLLFGDGHYNNRKIDGSNNYLISYETSASLAETSSTVCDDYFGFLDDEEGGRKDSYGRYVISGDVVDIGIGRIPVHNAADAEAVVKKIIDYSNNSHYGSWKNKLCFLSDDDKISDAATDTPNAHMKHNDQVIDILQNQQGHKEYIYQKIYLPAYSQTTTASGTDYPDAKKQFLESLQQGVLLVNYAGHGATNSITHEMLMTSARASQLNMKNLPLWVTASCDISRWDNDDDSMGEILLTNHNGGAIALITTVRVVYAQQNLSLNTAIARNLFKRKNDGSRFRLGDIIMSAKQSLGSDYNKLNFCLLGDPSMTLAYPEYKMEITDVEYGEKTTLKGRVISAETEDIAVDFNGLVYPTIYDSSDTIFADKGLHQEQIYSFETRTRKIFSGRDVIRNGLFEFSFFTPKDVSEFTTDGLVNLYACDESNNEGNGFFEKMTINRPSTNVSNDTIGPEILKLFVNSPDFENNSIVGSTPYFYAEVHDNSGFNVTGNGIGHDITLTIKCTSNTLLSSKQYILNDYLTTYTGDPTTGNIRYTIPELEEGEYDVTFKIWDSFNNSSSKTIHFSVSNKTKYSPLLVQAFPSPTVQDDMVTIRVLHNLPESPTTVRLQIYTQTGIKVYETISSATSAETLFLNKDSKDYTNINTDLNADESSLFVGASSLKWKASVVPGIYIYKVYLSSNGSEVSTDSKLLMVKPK